MFKPRKHLVSHLGKNSGKLSKLCSKQRPGQTKRRVGARRGVQPPHAEPSTGLRPGSGMRRYPTYLPNVCFLHTHTRTGMKIAPGTGKPLLWAPDTTGFDNFWSVCVRVHGYFVSANPQTCAWACSICPDPGSDVFRFIAFFPLMHKYVKKRNHLIIRPTNRK